MSKQSAPVARLQAEKRSADGGGTLPKVIPKALAGHLPSERWEVFRDVVNRALKLEKTARQKIRSTGGVPTLLLVASAIGSTFCFVIVQIIQLDASMRAIGMAAPPALGLCVWALLYVLQRKHFRKHTRALADVRRQVQEACDKLTRDHRSLVVSMHMGEEAVQALDWLGRARFDTKDSFYVDFYVVEPGLQIGDRSQSRASDYKSEITRSTRPPSADVDSDDSSPLRLAAQADELILRPVSAPDTSLSWEASAWKGSRLPPDRTWTPSSDNSRASKQAWA